MNKKLINKFKHAPEIKKILRHKHVPKYILNRNKILQIQKESKFKKFKNKEQNSKIGSLAYNPEKTDKIVKSGTISK